jgi:hypothetical protein
MKFYRDPKIVKFTPIATLLAFNVGNVMHIVRMWSVGTSVGQSLWGWMLSIVALTLWCNWYIVFTPEQKIPFYTAAFSIVVNLAVALTVFILR